MLSQRIAKKLRCPRSFANDIITALSDVILSELYLGNEIGLGEVGCLKIRERKERIGINPSTKKKMAIPKALTLKITNSKALRTVLHKRLETITSFH